MSGKEITAIAIKFFAIWLFVNVVLYAPAMITTVSGLSRASEQEIDQELYFVVVGGFFLVGLIASLVLFRVSNSVLSAVQSSELDDRGITEAILLQILGVYFLVSTLASMPGMAMRLFIASEYTLVNYLYFAGDFFLLGVAIYLIKGPTTLLSILGALRGSAECPLTSQGYGRRTAAT